MTFLPILVVRTDDLIKVMFVEFCHCRGSFCPSQSSWEVIKLSFSHQLSHAMISASLMNPTTLVVMWAPQSLWLLY